MPTFNSIEALRADILRKCTSAVAETEERVHSVIDATLKQFYGEFTPAEYIRTNQLMHSLVKTNVIASGNSVEAEVYFDASALNYASPVQGKSGKYHEALYNGGEVLDMAMSGSHGGYTNGTAIWAESNAKLGNIFNILKENLISNGIPIVG